MATWNPRANDIFLDAREVRDPAARSAFVLEACRGEPELREQVLALLGAADQAGSFLDRPAVAPSATGTFEPSPEAEAGPLMSSAVEAVGAMIGPYKLLQQIGEGGMGVVYMAEQSHPVRRQVALKVIKAGMDSRQVVARFEAERQALALMDHVNIARVFDGGTTESGRPYFVMELVRGVPITRYCDDNHLTPRQRLELFVPVCQAIQHAHQKGIIHRDIKPSNVMVTLYDGRPVPKVIDFGVAKATEQKLTDRTLFTQYGSVVGTLEYMSPEQAEMSALGVDTRSDIYSLGVLLYELLTGSTPLDHKRMKQAAFAEILRLIKEEEPPRPSTRLSDSGEALAAISALRQMEPANLTRLVRGELDWIVMRTLEKDRGRRYETANGFAADIQRYLADETVEACPPSAAYRLRKFARRNMGPVLAVSLVMLALTGGIVGTTVGLIRATEARADAVAEAGKKNEALTAAEVSTDDARHQLFSALLSQARAGRFSRQMGQRLDSLASLERAARIRPDERLRDEAMAAMALPDVRRGPILRPLSSDRGMVTFDDLYQSYARIDRHGVVNIHNMSDNGVVRRIAVNGPTGTAHLSPNGRHVLVLNERTARLWRVADGKPILGDEPMPCSNFVFSPDSTRWAIAQDDRVVVFDLKTGQETKRYQLPAKVFGMAFHPDGRRLAVGYESGTIASVLTPDEGGRTIDLPLGETIREAVVAWHPDGNRLAVSGSKPHIQMWDVAGRLKLATLEGHEQQVTVLSFHPDGDLLASCSWDGSVRLWDTATGRQLMKLAIRASPRFSGDGRYLGCMFHGSEQVQLLEVTPSREYRTLAGSLVAGNEHYDEGDISPDGRLLGIGSRSGRDRIWDLGSGREVAVLPTRSTRLLFGRAGRELLTCGNTGLHRWSIGERPTGELHIGPPRRVVLPAVPHRPALSSDGRSLAVVSEEAGAALRIDLDKDSPRGEPLDHPHACYVAGSPDGCWVATSGWHSDRVRLWDAKTGAMAHEWVPGTQTRVAFTPDSRALIICRGDEFAFYDVNSRELTRRLTRHVDFILGQVAFSPDGTLMAIEMAPAEIHLKEVATGRTVAKLEDPHGDRASWMGFTPDGTQLVVTAAQGHAVHVWNLRAVRDRLKPMGLDWDWPEFPSAGPVADAAEPVTVKVFEGDLAEPVLTREQKARRAIDRYRIAIEANPDDAMACNNLAWAYLTAPESLRDVKAAIPLAEKAARMDPSNPIYGNTLGVAYFRAGEHRKAVEVLRVNRDRETDQALAFDLYFLAMSHHRLGEADRARDYFDWAVRWSKMKTTLTAADTEELELFRTEAVELLGIDLKKK